jgi:hypothetical protein
VTEIFRGKYKLLVNWGSMKKLKRMPSCHKFKSEGHKFRESCCKSWTMKKASGNKGQGKGGCFRVTGIHLSFIESPMVVRGRELFSLLKWR